MSALRREYSEKRNFMRMKVDPRAQVIVETDDNAYEGICHDLSGGGMLLTLQEEIPLDTDLMVTLKSAHGHSPMLQATCTVVRVEPGPQQSWILGLEIQQVVNQPEMEEVSL